METVAFYSYKGGVGRSLLLANAARFLAMLGKGVVALDLDLEAPGLHYKLGGTAGPDLPPGQGAVPYLIATTKEGAPRPTLDTMPVLLAADSKGWLRLMPAGPAPHQRYWAALNKELSEKLRLAEPGSQGFMAMLDLQARISDELKPDYLLVDVPNGVTEIGSLATTVLADTVVCMFVGNQESLDGTLAVAQALTTARRLNDQNPIRVAPVLARTAKPPHDERFGRGVKRLLELGEGKQRHSKNEIALLTLPHDEVLEERAGARLYEAYLDLFEILFPRDVRRL